MAKTIAEYFEREDKKKPEHKTFYLDDVLDKNPREYCPNCESHQVKSLHTHNPDGYDFKCEKCQSAYTIMMCKQREDFYC